MKLEATFFGVPARILRGQAVNEVVSEIARLPGQEDAFVVLDVGDVVQKVKTWRTLLPRVKLFYAVKCNDNKTVLQILSSLGTGFDCASKTEMKKVLELGIGPERIVYAHPCKPASHLRQAAASGVDLMTFDNETELYKVQDIMPEARLVIRIRCDAAKAQCPLGEKFGVDPDKAPYLLARARSLGLNVVGVSFHVGSGCQEPQVFLRAIKAAREVFNEAINLGFEPYLLDIGGGFPGTTGTSLSEAAGYINTALEEHFPEDDIQVIAEPGRYVVASAFTLATQVISKRCVEAGKGSSTGSDTGSIMYYINDGVYGSFNCILYDHQDVHPKPLDEYVTPSDNNNPEEGTPKTLYSSSIWGPTCDSFDQVVSDVQLPELNVGDWVVWRDMGAYTISAAGTFNGFPLPLVHVVVPLHTWLSLEGILTASVLTSNKELASNKEVSEKLSSTAMTLTSNKVSEKTEGCQDPSGPLHEQLGTPQGGLRTPVSPYFGHFAKDQENNMLDQLSSGLKLLDALEI